MAKMNPLQLGFYAATGKLVGKLPIPENAEIARKAASEGIVLLENDGILPIAPVRAALYGAGSMDTAFCGTGSGYAFSPYTVSVYQGLRDAGFEITTSLWLQNYEKKRKEAAKNDKKLTFLDKRFSGITPYFDVDLITKEELEAAMGSDVAFYVIKRNAGETADREAVKGDYYLSDNEKENITLLCKTFPKTIVILNTCVVDARWLKEESGINALVLLGQAGLEAGHALADILTGKISPSGRLTDTFALDYPDYPASRTFSSNDGNAFRKTTRKISMSATVTSTQRDWMSSIRLATASPIRNFNTRISMSMRTGRKSRSAWMYTIPENGHPRMSLNSMSVHRREN